MLYTFEETVSMSSYLSAFIISKFKYIEAISKHNIRLRVYIPIDLNSDTGNFALDCGIKMIDFAVNYYNISFKFDLFNMFFRCTNEKSG
jgi:aminopeptidase N